MLIQPDNEITRLFILGTSLRKKPIMLQDIGQATVSEIPI